jgi:hypothetical protein
MMFQRIFCLAVLLSFPAFSQTVAGFGAISGLVRDASGGVVPDAEVVVANPERGIKRPLRTNDVGIFSASSLVPSSGYVVMVSKPGFTNFEARDLEVQVGQIVSVDVLLTIAGTTLRVDLQATAPIIEPAKTDVSQVVNSEQILNLPINGRRVDSFVLLTPAVVPDGTFGLLAFRGTAGGNSFLTDGNDTTNQYYNENAGRTRITTQISQDAVQEFQVLSDGYSAEFGRALGGVVNTVTRSGSNDLHGTAYWFFRNQDFNARDPFATTNPDETRHQAGASIGGKLITDKLFYFVNGEIVRRDFPLSASLRNPPFFDANGQFVATQPNGQPTCAPPATSEQCTAAVRFLDRHFQTLQRTADSELGFAKLDWRPNERHSVSASMNYLRFISPNGLQTGAAITTGSGVGNNANSTVQARYGRLSWIALPGVNVVNEFRFGWFKDKQFDYVSDELSLPGIGLLGLTIQGQTNLGTAVDYPRLNPSENRYQFADNLNWNRGRHSIKMGADVMTTQDYNDTLRNRTGTFTYPTFTAFALDLTGNSGAKRWQNYSQRFGNPIVDIRSNDFGFYIQDQFRVSANLTLNLGLRYDYAALPQPITDSPDRVNPAFPATGRIPSANKNFGPRFGISYAFNDAKTVVRAGYGIFYGRYPNGLINTFFLENGMSQTLVNLNASVASDLAAGPVFPNRLLPIDSAAPPTGWGVPPGTVDLTFPSNSFRNAYTQQGNVAIEHEISPNVGITVSYLWSRGFHLTTVRDLNVGVPGAPIVYRINDEAGNQVGAYATPAYLRANRVNPLWNRVNLVDSDGKSYYDGLAVQARKRLSHGFEGSLAYTWSHAIDYNQGFGSQNIFFSSGPATLFNGDYRGEKGTSSLDQRHRLTVSSIWSPEFAKSGGRLRRFWTNDWQLSQISTFASAPPTTAVIAVTGTPFAGAAFNTTLNGFGGSTRVPFLPLNSLDLDPVIRTDARIAKALSLSDRFRLNVIFEAFNVFNHTYATGAITRAYNASNGVLTPSPRLGEGNVTGGFPDGTNARRAQVALRLLW